MRAHTETHECWRVHTHSHTRMLEGTWGLTHRHKMSVGGYTYTHTEECWRTHTHTQTISRYTVHGACIQAREQFFGHSFPFYLYAGSGDLTHVARFAAIVCLLSHLAGPIFILRACSEPPANMWCPLLRVKSLRSLPSAAPPLAANRVRLSL